MNRPPFEVADVIRTAGDSFREQYGDSLTWPQRKVLDAIVRWRTAALGGHRDQCVSCGREAISYNSCRNRHCPKCQAGARDLWLATRQQELLDVGYYHLVFSVPHELVPLMLHDIVQASVRPRGREVFVEIRNVAGGPRIGPDKEIHKMKIGNDFAAVKMKIAREWGLAPRQELPSVVLSCAS